MIRFVGWLCERHVACKRKISSADWPNYITMRIFIYNLENKRGELEALSTISEEEVCYVYNVDSKSEIVKILSDEIETLEREVEYLTPLDWSNDPVAEIFGGYEAMNNYLY